jgi:formylglycine-generating enzyme required for sulfatase activity
MLHAAMGIFDPECSKAVAIGLAIEAAEALGQAGDPRFAPENLKNNCVTIPPGEFLMGAQKEDHSKPNYDPDAYDDESPVHKVKLAEYRIGRYPVTVGEYQRFIDAGGYANEQFWKAGGFGKWTAPDRWDDQQQHPTQPVIYVTWFEAAAYAAHVGGRLPTEAQWERAARGTDGRHYPWGNAEPEKTLLNFRANVGRPTPVGVYPCGASPQGVLDMAGNVWEWCQDWRGPYAQPDQADPTGPGKGTARVVRGGAWDDYPVICRAAYRNDARPDNRDYGVGFRVALDFR